MLRLSIFCFALCLVVVAGSLYQVRLAPPEKLMLVEHDQIGDARVVLFDPMSGKRFELTKTYHEVRLVKDNNDWLYFWGKKGVTAPNNVMRLYRVNPQENIQQELLSDAYSESYVRFIWAENKIIYITRVGNLASMNLDGSAKETIPIPPDIKPAININTWFDISSDQQWITLSARQGSNIDIVMIDRTGTEAHNLTEQLPTPHVCTAIYSFEDIDLVWCNNVIYSRRSTDDQLQIVLPSNEDRGQVIIDISADNILKIADLDPETQTIYAIDLNQTTYPLVYTLVEPTLPVVVRANEWRIVRERREDHFELWHVDNDARRTKLGDFEFMPFSYQLADNAYLLVVSDSVQYITDIYQLSPDGRQIKPVYRTTDYMVPIGTSLPKDTLYFAQATSYRPRVYQLKSIDKDGNTQTYTDWHQHDRLTGWTDIFAQNWSPLKWVIVGLGLIGVLFFRTFTFAKNHGDN